VDWQSCTIHDLAGSSGSPDRTVRLPDPLVSRTPELDDLLELLAANAD